MPFKNTENGYDDCISEIIKIVMTEKCCGECCCNREDAPPQIRPGPKGDIQKISRGKQCCPAHGGTARGRDTRREGHQPLQTQVARIGLVDPGVIEWKSDL